MPRLRRPAWRGVLKDRDRGAVATIVAILIAGGVLLGFMALVVDVGQIYVEREELQSGADAAALAIAKACATNGERCDTTARIEDLAQTYANDNAGDAVHNVVLVCGFLPGKLSPCDAPADNLTQCLGEPPDDGSSYVEVRLSTQLPNGRFVLPPMFAQTMAGNSGYTGADVGACARATWEPRGSIHILAITLSVCEYSRDTDGANPPGTEPGPHLGSASSPQLVDESIVDFWHNHFDGRCGSVPDGNTPEGEDWENPEWAAFLSGGGPDCEVTIPADGVLEGQRSFESDGDANIEGDCADRLARARQNREIVYIPLHDGQGDNSSPGEQFYFHHKYLAPFLVTGFRFGPLEGDDADPSGRYFRPSFVEPDPGDPCPESDRRCLSGIFLNGLRPITDIAGGDAIVRLIG